MGVGTDDVAGRQHSVVYIEPETATAPPPPGLTHWPRPGEAVLSPALLKAGDREGIQHRYEHLSGTIGEAGLEAPEERFAYIRPRVARLDRADMHPVRSFGAPRDSTAPFGESMFIPAFPIFTVGLAGLILLPAGALVIASVRTGSAARVRGLVLFEALGATKTARIFFTAGEAAVPAALGPAAASALISPAFLVDLPFPWVDCTLSKYDVRNASWPLAGAGLSRRAPS